MSIDSLELPHYEKYIKVAEKHNGVFLPMSRNFPIFDGAIFDKETGEVIFTSQFKYKTGVGLNSDSLKRYIKKYDGVDGLDIASLNRDAPNLFSKYYLFNDYKTSGNIFFSNFHKDWIVEKQEVIHKKVEDAVEIIIKNKEWQDKHKDSMLKQIEDKFPKLCKDENVFGEDKYDHFDNIKDIDLNNIQKKIIQTLKEIEINNK